MVPAPLEEQLLIGPFRSRLQHLHGVGIPQHLMQIKGLLRGNWNMMKSWHTAGFLHHCLGKTY